MKQRDNVVDFATVRAQRRPDDERAALSRELMSLGRMLLEDADRIDALFASRAANGHSARTQRRNDALPTLKARTSRVPTPRPADRPRIRAGLHAAAERGDMNDSERAERWRALINQRVEQSPEAWTALAWFFDTIYAIDRRNRLNERSRNRDGGAGQAEVDASVDGAT
jgi:hypothetical protein